MIKRLNRKWEDLPIKMKILAAFALTSAIMFAMNLGLYWQVNRTTQKIDRIYSSNVNLSEMADSFTNVQNTMYSYLSVKSSNSLENYYRSEQAYRDKLELLNDQIVDNDMLMLEKNIRSMSDSYLAIAEEAVQAKRGRNVEKYKQSYEEAQKLYGYINSYIYELNTLQFNNNASSYQVMMNSLSYMEVISSALLILVTALNVWILTAIVQNITKPLTGLAQKAALVGEGNFDVDMCESDSNDEVGVVSRAFDKMVQSLKTYMERTKESMIKEQHMKEKELLMETHLKDAQLKYLQSQINPHFLFNSLNAGAQLAMMEDAEQTCLFIERMADFFRYNVKKVTESTTIREELEAVDNYIYILNVRFAGDIHFSKTLDDSVLDQVVPCMLLQPIVENAVNHGIRDVDWEGTIHLDVSCQGEFVRISVKDNGQGMTQEQIYKVLHGEYHTQESNKKNSTGIAMDNVIHRLELYYDQKNLLDLISAGPGKGTEAVMMLPIRQEG